MKTAEQEINEVKETARILQENMEKLKITYCSIFVVTKIRHFYGGVKMILRKHLINSFLSVISYCHYVLAGVKWIKDSKIKQRLLHTLRLYGDVPCSLSPLFLRGGIWKI